MKVCTAAQLELLVECDFIPCEETLQDDCLLLACSSDLCLTAWAKTRVDDGENSLLIIILLQAIQ